MSDEMKNKNNITILIGCDIIRLYYMDNEFYAMLVNSEEILPYATKKAHEMSDFIIKSIGNCPSPYLQFNHKKNSLSKSKQKKLKYLLSETIDADVTKELINKWVMMVYE